MAGGGEPGWREGPPGAVCWRNMAALDKLDFGEARKKGGKRVWAA